jgi:Family of unknown function (DUF6522)
MRRTGPPTEGTAINGVRPVIRIRGTETLVEADYLAEKLGLSAQQLQIEMQRRNVSGGLERGVGEDEGRLRLTFRYRTRVWVLIVEADGTLKEANSLVLGPDADQDEEQDPDQNGSGANSGPDRLCWRLNWLRTGNGQAEECAGAV